MIIYKATNLIDNKVYIGKTTSNLIKRKKDHIIKVNNNSNCYFHNALRKYGIKNFKWEILTKTNLESKLSTLEKFYIAIYKKMTTVYNMTDGGDGRSGYIYSIAERNKMSKRRTGMKYSEETKQKMSRARKGFKHSEESKKKMSEAKKGNKNTLGKRWSTKTRLKMSKSQKGNKNALGAKRTNEQKKILSNFHKGKILSKETKLKISKTRKEKIGNNSTNHKLVETQIRRIKFIAKCYNPGHGYWNKLAKALKITNSQISNIIHNKTWKYIEV